MTTGVTAIRPGRRALFESAPVDAALDASPMDERRPLFSAPPRAAGTMVVECSVCEARTPRAATELAVPVLLSLLSPLWMLAPYPHYLRCPACGQRTWCKLS